MEKLINMAAWVSGIGPKLWEKADGAKTYIAVTLKILTGLAGLLGELQPILEAHNLGGVATFCKGLSANHNWNTITDALLALGIGHSIKKAVPAP